MDLKILARTLAERLQAELSICMETEPCEVCINGAEAVIREAIEKTLEEAERLAELRGECAEIGGLLHNLNEQYKRGVIDSARQIQDAIRSLKQSNAVAEDEGPCAACGQPKSDSAMHLDSPGKGWGAALHWFKQSNSGRAEQEAGGRR